MGPSAAQGSPDSLDTTVGHMAQWPRAGGGPSSWGRPQAAALQAGDPPGAVEAVEDDEAEAVAGADARAEAEAPTGTTSGGEAAAVAEAVEAEKLFDAAGGLELPGEQPQQAGAA